ncbi:MerR family transcriptional regulator [Cellulomonas sp. PS-H5]|uniref:transcriptional regulator FtsR n=1 Tax=Cellulomonas sp. PS-H5 TaxID=2820400 RepID=UPI0027E39BE8|nr:MerR family transcriptional regulator [Cellulomonas sp. PS-H5]
MSPARSARHADAGPDDGVAAAGPAAPDAAAQQGGDTPGPWPRGLSREASMRISDVLAALRIEFPAVTNSKLRFLEEQGLVEPVRTPAGYRQYSPADLERLRYVLREQRDRYVPLKVIGERLAALDAGDESEPVSLVVTEDGVPRSGAADARYTTAALAREARVEEQLVADLVQAGVLRPSASGHLDAWAKEVVLAAAALAEHGLEARHLRAFRSAADRQLDMVEAVVAPWRGQTSASARGRASTVAAEVGELCARLNTALVRAGVADLAP